jgi:hypothetical protein
VNFKNCTWQNMVVQDERSDDDGRRLGDVDHGLHRIPSLLSTVLCVVFMNAGCVSSHRPNLRILGDEDGVVESGQTEVLRATAEGARGRGGGCCGLHRRRARFVVQIWERRSTGCPSLFSYRGYLYTEAHPMDGTTWRPCTRTLYGIAGTTPACQRLTASLTIGSSPSGRDIRTLPGLRSGPLQQRGADEA